MPQKLQPQKNSLYGFPSPNPQTQPHQIIARRAPTTEDTGYEQGQIWVDEVANNSYILNSVSAGSADWGIAGTASSGVLQTLTGDSGGAISPAANNITLAGTALQIETAGAGSTITFSIPATFSIGSTGGADSGTIAVGTGNFLLEGATASTITIGTGLTTGTITIGATGNTGTMTLSNSTGAQTVNIANANGAKTVNIGSGISGNTISVGNGANTSAQVINLAAGATAANSTVNILSGNGSAGTQTLNALTGTRAGAINLGTGAAAHVITVGSASAGAIAIDTAAGISLDGATASNFTVTGAGQDLTLSSVGGSIKVNSTEDAAGAIALTANGGTSETVTITSSQGTGAASINISSTAGGVTLAGGLATADAINLSASAGGVDIDGALQVNIASSQDAADAIRLNASAGGIDIDAVGAAGQDIVITNTGGSVSLVATEAVGDAIVLNASDAAGGIDLIAGTGNVEVTGNLVLAAVATQLQMNGGAVTDFIGEATLAAGTVTVANTNIAAGDRIYISRRAINGSTALGMLTYVINAGSDFVITAVQTATPAATETNDTSIVAYVIVRQN